MIEAAKTNASAGDLLQTLEKLPRSPHPGYLRDALASVNVLIELTASTVASGSGTAAARKQRPISDSKKQQKEVGAIKSAMDRKSQFKITTGQLCERLDERQVPLPQGLSWSHCSKWTVALNKFPRAVRPWISRCPH